MAGKMAWERVAHHGIKGRYRLDTHLDGVYEKHGGFAARKEAVDAVVGWFWDTNDVDYACRQFAMVVDQKRDSLSAMIAFRRPAAGEGSKPVAVVTEMPEGIVTVKILK